MRKDFLSHSDERVNGLDFSVETYNEVVGKLDSVKNLKISYNDVDKVILTLI
jgi:hypothetical protein